MTSDYTVTYTGGTQAFPTECMIRASRHVDMSQVWQAFTNRCEAQGLDQREISPAAYHALWHGFVAGWDERAIASAVEEAKR